MPVLHLDLRYINYTDGQSYLSKYLWTHIENTYLQQIKIKSVIRKSKQTFFSHSLHHFVIVISCLISACIDKHFYPFESN